MYFPDGNRRYAKKNNLPLFEAYKVGLEKSLRLLIDYFLIENRAQELVFVIYTYVRKDSTYDDVCNACEVLVSNFLDTDYFQEKNIKFNVVNNYFEFPQSLVQVIERLSSSTSLLSTDKKVTLLLGYSLEEDFNQALLSKPESYSDLRRRLQFKDIDLVLRYGELRLSNGPVYALGKTQMIELDKMNPEITREDLEQVWSKYEATEDYRNSLS